MQHLPILIGVFFVVSTVFAITALAGGLLGSRLSLKTDKARLKKDWASWCCLSPSVLPGN